MKHKPTAKTARLAPFIEAIGKAKKAGWMWEDLRVLFEDLGYEIADKPLNFRATYLRAKKRYEKGSLEAEQLPLPDTDAGPSDKTAQTDKTPDDQSSAVTHTRDADHQNPETNQEEQQPEPDPDDDDEDESLANSFKQRLKSRNQE